MNTLNQFWTAIAPFAITGGIVSLIVQYTKAAFEKSAHKTLWAIGIAIVAGIVVQFAGLVPTNWLTTIAAIVAAANTWYLLVLQWLETPDTSAPVNSTPIPPTPPAAA